MFFFHSKSGFCLPRLTPSFQTKMLSQEWCPPTRWALRPRIQQNTPGQSWRELCLLLQPLCGSCPSQYWWCWWAPGW